MDHDAKSNDTPIRRLSSAIELAHLRYAVAAADHGSVRQTAEALQLKQSTLSRCIRQLEHSIGMTVFERSSGGVRATEAGREFLRTARSILDQMDTLVAAAHSTGRGESGRLAIGFYTSLFAGNLRATLVEFWRRCPQIAVRLTESSRMCLATALRSGAIDIAIVMGETPLLDSKAMPLWSERIFVALPDSHRLAAGEPMYWTDLKGETILISRRDPGPELHNLLATKLVSPEGRPEFIHHDVSRENINGLVSAGFGISLTTEASIGAGFSGVTYREGRDGTGPARIGYWANWREDNDNPALARFLKLLGERYPLPVDGP